MTPRSQKDDSPSFLDGEDCAVIESTDDAPRDAPRHSPSSSSNRRRPATGSTTPTSTKASASTASSAPPSFLRCDSNAPFVSGTKAPAEVNATDLTLYLGLPGWLLSRERLAPLIAFIALVVDHIFLFAWWDQIFFFLYNNCIPVAVRRRLAFFAWRFVYVPCHARLLHRRTAIHADASLEYHAWTTLFYGARLFPVTVRRIRFALAQLTAVHEPDASPPPPLPSHSADASGERTVGILQVIDEPCRIHLGSSSSSLPPAIPEEQRDFCRVQGFYIRRRRWCSTQPTRGTSNSSSSSSSTATPYATNEQQQPIRHVLFWLYGGAFIGGDAASNVGPAKSMSDACEMDVFVPNFRRGPEFGMNDILWDVALSYRWFISQLKQQDQNGTCNSKVFLYGCSSGAGLCLRLVQFIAELQRGEELLPPYISVALQGVVTMPVGVALTSPFVDYSMERCSLGSFVQYGKHDLLVHEGVQEIGLSVADKVMGGMSDAHSPLSHSMQGLPPLCVVFSEHEVTYDETVVLVNLARKENVRVTVGLWKFMCHAWCFFGAFIPEGRQAMDFVRDWYMDQKQVQSTSSIRAS